jgi:Right handed beta helix region
MKTSWPLLLTLVLSLQPALAAARTWTVPADAASIQAGIDSCAVGDVVAVAAGTYTEIGLLMRSGITLRGTGDEPTDVVLDGQASEPDGERILTLGPDPALVSTRIENLTFANGNNGGLSCIAVDSVTIERCVFRDNATPNTGGGLYVSQTWGSLLVRDCVFEGNRAVQVGGGAYIQRMSEARFENTLFLRNQSDLWGAAVAASEGEENTAIDQCTFVGQTGDGSYTSLFFVGMAVIDFSRSIAAYNEVGFATTGMAHLGFVLPTCSDLIANGDDNYSTWTFTDGNFSADPCFCDPDGDDYRLAADSWCLGGLRPWECNDLVGAFDAGCDVIGCSDLVGTEKKSMSSLKALFR